MNQYIETGTTNTPNHGRGQRTSKKNGRYLESDEEHEPYKVIKLLDLFYTQHTANLGCKKHFRVKYAMTSMRH